MSRPRRPVRVLHTADVHLESDGYGDARQQAAHQERGRRIFQRIVDRALIDEVDLLLIAGGWLTEVTGPDGRPVTRPGRGTFVLQRRGGKWLAVHSHFSLLPTQSETAHGRLSSDSARS